MTKKEENREERRKVEEENEKIVSLLNKMRYESNGFEICKHIDTLLKAYIYSWGTMEGHKDQTTSIFYSITELKSFLLEIEENFPNRHNF